MNKKNMIIARNFLAFTGFFTIIFIGNFSSGKNSKVESQIPIVHSEVQYATNLSDDRVLVGASHNIFVGKVIKQLGDEDGGIGAETQFQVEVLENIKGELQGTIVVDQEGGYKNGKLYTVSGGDVDLSVKDTSSYLLEPGAVYLLATRYNSKKNWYTLISYPTAKALITKNNLGNEELTRISKENTRVQALSAAYPKEILLGADVKNNNTRNSHKLNQEVKD